MTNCFEIKTEEEYRDCFGFSEPWNRAYGVNIEAIWQRSLRRTRLGTAEAAINLFIRDYALTIAHELIHIEIYYLIPPKLKYFHRDTNKFAMGEEKAIFSLLDEVWYKKTEKYYNKHYPYTKRTNRGKIKQNEKP